MLMVSPEDARNREISTMSGSWIVLSYDSLVTRFVSEAMGEIRPMTPSTSGFTVNFLSLQMMTCSPGLIQVSSRSEVTMATVRMIVSTNPKARTPTVANEHIKKGFIAIHCVFFVILKLIFVYNFNFKFYIYWKKFTKIIKTFLRLN